MTDPTAAAAKLLPCPFCGGEAEIEAVAAPLDRTRWSVGCKESLPDEVQTAECMGYQSLTSFATKREAIAAWNTRPQPAPPEGAPDFLCLAYAHRGIFRPYPTFDQQQAECQSLEEFGERMYRLGLAARPRVQDAEVAIAEALTIAEASKDDTYATGTGLPNHAKVARAAIALAAKLAEREAELAKADGFLMLGWSIDDALDEHPYDNIGDIAREVQKRHAARQQQKASAKSTDAAKEER